MPAPQIVLDLAERFRDNREAYRSPTYNETQLRHEFLDPFFEALGWDMNNRQGYAEQYKDVVHEDSIRMGGAPSAPDYCFRIGGTRKFFLEAKKPAVNLHDDPSPAFQVRRYAWSAHLPLSVLSDFEELALYDCRTKPVISDKAAVGRVQYFRCAEYGDRWDEIAGVLSREAVLKGAFDKYVESTAGKRGTADVDDTFLKEIEAWREALAENLALRNPQLGTRELNFSVQRTIDRIIFLRICEDRGVEEYGKLLGLINGAAIYDRLRTQFRMADDRYNSGLFHFLKDKERSESPDEITPGLAIDDKVLREIIQSLYYPTSPYAFDVMPAEILGQVYEQFLGKVIRLTPGHRAKVEDKPEVKKAGGVYYTPKYIVDYIVEQTVGKLLENKTPKEASGLRILDPACGSGSFLIGAYQYLLDWHVRWYTEHGPEAAAKGKRPALFQHGAGDWRLTTAERKRILLNNIYGVDIDPQAVEVTKLSLLLKVLEGESRDTLAHQLVMLHERALPDLGGNIKCGNSLIGSDFYQGQQASFLDDEERYRVNAFDWEVEFAAIMKAGGFDAVVGNPPYGFHQIHSDLVKPYFKRRFVTSQGSFEHYMLFFEATLRLIRPNGIHGFIVPVTWLTIPSARSLRRFVLENYWIMHIDWLPELVFAHAQVNTLVSVIRRSSPGAVHIRIHKGSGLQSPPSEERWYEQSAFVQADSYIGIFESERDATILAKIEGCSRPLGQYARPRSGYNPYEVGKGQAPEGGPHTPETVARKPYHSAERLCDDWKPEIVGRDLRRYSVDVTGRRWVKYGPWLSASRDPGNFLGKRILVQEITGGADKRLVAAYFDGELYHSRDVIPIKTDAELPSPKYLLAVINSRLLTWYHRRRNPKAQKGLFPKVLVSDLARLPIRSIESSELGDVAHHDRMVSLVDRMLSLHRQLSAARLDHERTMLQRQIDATDREIDALVYELYGLTEDEVAIVEGRAGEETGSALSRSAGRR